MSHTVDSLLAQLDNNFFDKFPEVSDYAEFRNWFENQLGNADSYEYIRNNNVVFDSDFLNLYWWLYKMNLPKIKDFLHGYGWTPYNVNYELGPDGILEQALEKDPIAIHERVKAKDYIKHINWVYHKTQNLPRIVLIGEGNGNISLRHYNLRQCYITRLDPPSNAIPREELFIDHIQRNNTRNLSTIELTSNKKISREYFGTQNIVILDDPRITHDPTSFINTIETSEKFLTHHGRFLFDLPVQSAWCSSLGIYPLLKSVTKVRQFMGKTIDVMIDYIHEAVRSVNNGFLKHNSESCFKIEEIKLTEYGNADGVIGLRVMLKKN